MKKKIKSLKLNYEKHKKYLILRKLDNYFKYDQLKSIKLFIITRIRILIPQDFIKYSQQIISQVKLRNII